MGMGSLLNKLLQNQNQHVSHCLRRKEPKKLWEINEDNSFISYVEWY